MPALMPAGDATAGLGVRGGTTAFTLDVEWRHCTTSSTAPPSSTVIVSDSSVASPTSLCQPRWISRSNTVVRSIDRSPMSSPRLTSSSRARSFGQDAFASSATAHCWRQTGCDVFLRSWDRQRCRTWSFDTTSKTTRGEPSGRPDAWTSATRNWFAPLRFLVSSSGWKGT